MQHALGVDEAAGRLAHHKVEIGPENEAAEGVGEKTDALGVGLQYALKKHEKHQQADNGLQNGPAKSHQGLGVTRAVIAVGKGVEQASKAPQLANAVPDAGRFGGYFCLLVYGVIYLEQIYTFAEASVYDVGKRKSEIGSRKSESGKRKWDSGKLLQRRGAESAE